MKVKILNRVWKVEQQSDPGLLMNCCFPQRVINYNKENIYGEEMLKHCICHEVTHAYQAELGQWKNLMQNGSMKDHFDSEWIAEFVAIHGEGIIEVTNNILSLFKMKEE